MPDNVSAEELKQLVERIETIEEQLSETKDDRKDMYLEAKSRGFDTKTLRAIVALRKIEKHKRDEAEALLETYKTALGLA